MVLCILLLLTVAAGGPIPNIECMENIECEIDLGKGACCLSFFTAKGSWQRCRDASFVNYYTKSSMYDPRSRLWTNPHDHSEQILVHCVRELTPNPLPQVYPFEQPWSKIDLVVNRRDFIYKGAQSIDFYRPKAINNNSD